MHKDTDFCFPFSSFDHHYQGQEGEGKGREGKGGNATLWFSEKGTIRRLGNFMCRSYQSLFFFRLKQGNNALRGLLLQFKH